MLRDKKLFCAAAHVTFVLLSLNESSAAEKCRHDTPYYFSEINPASWRVEDELNYEEVYKNFEYFEVSFNRSCDEITVKRYKKGQFDSSEKYKLDSDGSIQKGRRQGTGEKIGNREGEKGLKD